MNRKPFKEIDWRRHLNPVFVRYCLAEKRLRLASSGSEADRRLAFLDLAAESRALNEERSSNRFKKYEAVWAEIIRPLDGEVRPDSGEPGRAYAVNPEGSAFFRDLVFLKFGVSYRQLVTAAEKDSEAHKKLLRVHRLYYEFRWKKRGFANLQLRFSMTHFQLIVQGLDFGLGGLNEFEFEACFNEICPCAQRHSGEYVRKTVRAIKKACDALLESAKTPTSFELS